MENMNFQSILVLLIVGVLVLVAVKVYRARPKSCCGGTKKKKTKNDAGRKESCDSCSDCEGCPGCRR